MSKRQKVRGKGQEANCTRQRARGKLDKRWIARGKEAKDIMETVRGNIYHILCCVLHYISSKRGKFTREAPREAEVRGKGGRASPQTPLFPPLIENFEN